MPGTGCKTVLPQQTRLPSTAARCMTEYLSRLRSPLQRLLLPLLAWGLVMWLQTQLIVPRCATVPADCDPDSLAFWDRWSLAGNRPWAVVADERLQLGTTLVAVAVPLALQPALTLPHFSRLAADWILVLEVGLWNVVATETTQLLVQRPRPALHTRPPSKPLDRKSQYTSFYSGHTSYVGAVLMSGVALAWVRRRRRLATALFIVALTATVATGALRILEGRHFLLDVVAGGLAGGLLGWFWTRRALESTTPKPAATGPGTTQAAAS